ncbi:MFS-type transporter clz9 [Anthophora plagiata]
MNVTDHSVPPSFIFPRKRIDNYGQLMIKAPLDSTAILHENGWMNRDIFLRWLQHFKHHVQPTKKNPVLLILDGHASHKELAVTEYARENYVHMFSTPSHTIHKTQPLGRTFFKQFKSSFASVNAEWMRRNPEAKITDYNVAALINTAFSQAVFKITQNGFRCTRIYPLNCKIFSDIVGILYSW